MIIHFGLELEENVYPTLSDVSGTPTFGVHYRGGQGLLQLIEQFCGLSGLPNNIEHLRIEQFRQSTQLHAKQNPDAFYQKSFQADQLGTSADLLNRRDELLLAGWDFKYDSKTPNRLKTIAEINSICLSNAEQSFIPGFADRFMKIIEVLPERTIPIQQVMVNEPKDIIPAHFLVLFEVLESKGVEITYAPSIEPHQNPQTDLECFQNILLGDFEAGEKVSLKNDGSLLILEAKRETEGAAFLARVFSQNSTYRPVCLIPDKNRALDNAFIQEGLPSLGILSDSTARPLLQILKLATTFLWKPIDPFKILEFVSLPVKPLPDYNVELVWESNKENEKERKERTDLSTLIAKEMAQVPGLKSDRWNLIVRKYFDALQNLSLKKSAINFRNARKQYDFWFSRKTYNINETVPVTEVIEIYQYLSEWSSNYFNDNDSKLKSLIVLSDQARRIVELLESLPNAEKELNFLELERIVRTIYEPSPVLFKPKEVSHLPYVHNNSAIIDKVSSLLWWNFMDTEQEYFFSKWYKSELAFLNNLNVELDGPSEKNKRLLWKRNIPILRAERQVLLVKPRFVDGKEVLPHPLIGDMEARFSNIENISINISKFDNIQLLANQLHIDLPKYTSLDVRQIGSQKPYVFIDNKEKLQERLEESFSSLDALFYYPYKWLFQYQIGLKKSSILSIVKENTMMGNLSHRVIEFLLKEDGVLTWTKKEIKDWINKSVYRLLEREGAVLLMYGREPDRMAFINKIKFAACALIESIRSNNWEIHSTEQKLVDTFKSIGINGKADLVLKNQNNEYAVVDLKWRGAKRRENQIKSEEDLQLVLYSKLLTKDDSWVHTAYFIMEDGKMIARNNKAFADAIVPTQDVDHIEINNSIWQKMNATYQWRMRQIKDGKIEIRTENTLVEIEDEMTLEEINTMLEMKSENAPFDDYKTLIQSVK